MYEEHYGLIEPPFSLTPDPKYFYRSEAHTRAFELLQYGIERREGFIIVYGDIGTGKTTLCRTVLAGIDKDVSTALLLNPFLSEIDLIKAILEDFNVKLPRKKAGEDGPLSKQKLINALNDFLLKTLEAGGRAVVIIDEAQNIPMATLEQIRILSNLETHKEKRLQIVLVGQLNLIDVLSQPELRQLFQRVSIKCELSALSEAESGDYLRHRLSVAGGSPSKVAFAESAAKQIYAYSGGVPRLINLIADRTLLAGLAVGASTIDASVALQAIENLQLEKPPRKTTPTSLGGKVRGLKQAAIIVGLSILLATIFVVLMNALGGN
jgi:general secretion pathway protein A